MDKRYIPIKETIKWIFSYPFLFNDAASTAIPKGGGAFLICSFAPRTRGEINTIFFFDDQLLK